MLVIVISARRYDWITINTSECCWIQGHFKQKSMVGKQRMFSFPRLHFNNRHQSLLKFTQHVSHTHGNKTDILNFKMHQLIT